MPDDTALSPGCDIAANDPPTRARRFALKHWIGGGMTAGRGVLPLCLSVVVLAGLSISHNVEKVPSAEDALFIRRMLSDSGHGAILAGPATSFDEEIDRVLEVQDAVLRAAPVNDGIPLGQLREPRELYEAHSGLCYDRSRSIEKALALLGMETRHVAVYSLADALTPLDALFSSGTPSHALTEVLTRRGWMLVDSNDRWIGLQANGQPVSADDLEALGDAVVWSPRMAGDMAPIFHEDFIHVYGLYSRHGLFYPPMDGVPDVNLAELVQNRL